jgi:hypothetical protein
MHRSTQQLCGFTSLIIIVIVYSNLDFEAITHSFGYDKSLSAIDYRAYNKRIGVLVRSYQYTVVCTGTGKTECIGSTSSWKAKTGLLLELLGVF